MARKDGLKQIGPDKWGDMQEKYSKTRDTCRVAACEFLALQIVAQCSNAFCLVLSVTNQPWIPTVLCPENARGKEGSH